MNRIGQVEGEDVESFQFFAKNWESKYFWQNGADFPLSPVEPWEQSFDEVEVSYHIDEARVKFSGIKVGSHHFILSEKAGISLVGGIKNLDESVAGVFIVHILVTVTILGTENGNKISMDKKGWRSVLQRNLW